MASVMRPESVFTPFLKNVAAINPRFDRSQVTDKNDPASFVPMANVSEQLGVITEEANRPVSELLKGFTPFKDRDVLVAKITPCFENGKIAHARIGQRFGFGSTEFHVVRPDAGVLDDRYLFHFLRRDRVRIDGERNMTGSAGQRRVPKRFLEELRIPLPSLPEQRRIAAILDKADALRQKRRAAIAKLDQLLQSVFLEMFGDPVTNPNAAVATLGELCARVTDGTHQAPEWSESGVPFIFQSHIKPSSISLQTEKFISEKEYERLTNRCPIERGDVLYTIVGSYGNAAVVRTDEKFAFQRHVAHIKPANHVLPDFLESMLNSTAIKRQVDQRVTGVAQKTLILRELKELKVLVPSRSEQERFKSVAVSARNAMCNQTRQAKRLESCFASLQQRAFTGQL